MSVPFHKQLDPNKQAGQVVFPLPKEIIIFAAQENVGKSVVIEQYDDYLIYEDPDYDDFGVIHTDTHNGWLQEDDV